MDEMKRKPRSLKSEFCAAVLATLLAVAAASALTVLGLWRFRAWLLPDPNEVMLRVRVISEDGEEREFSGRLEIDGGEMRLTRLKKSENESVYDVSDAAFSAESVDSGARLTGPRRRAAYVAAGAAMVALPMAYSLAGVLLCAVRFYRKKLAPAITALDDAARHISEQDLDFTVPCPTRNELGRLCLSFERMRAALYDNNLRLWRTLEGRRTMQASVAHDLRNPIAIMEGTVEHVRALEDAGALTPEALRSSLSVLAETSKRMERYTDCIRDLDAIEDIEPDMRETALSKFLVGAAESVRVIADAKGLDADIRFDVPDCRAMLDREIFYRVLENVFSNAVRYAKSRVTLGFELLGGMLTARVSDDGPGFSARMLRKKNSLYYSEDETGGHMGLGLATSRILCGKHGGGIALANRPEGGAEVTMTFAVRVL